MTPAPAITVSVPLEGTLSVVVSALLSMSATETPAIGNPRVLGDGLRGRHGVDRGVVDGHDLDKRGRGLAVVYSVIDDNFE